jgi:hypothetical protein
MTAIMFSNEMPEEDSEDLTNMEILEAVPTSEVDDVIRHLQAKKCPACAARNLVAGHALRRRAPHLYWRVGLRCANGHELQVTFQTDWIKR